MARHAAKYIGQYQMHHFRNEYWLPVGYFWSAAMLRAAWGFAYVLVVERMEDKVLRSASVLGVHV